MRRMVRGTGSAQVLTMDLSFNEPLLTLEWLDPGERGPRIPAYSLHEFVAEKFRAILQQPRRQRNRPQDAFDIDVLLSTQPELQDPAGEVRRACGAARARGTARSGSSPALGKGLRDARRAAVGHAAAVRGDVRARHHLLRIPALAVRVSGWRRPFARPAYSASGCRCGSAATNAGCRRAAAVSGWIVGNGDRSQFMRSAL